MDGASGELTLASAFRCALYATAVIGFLLIYGLLQERIMSVPYDGDLFTFSVLLVLLNRLVTVLFAGVMIVGKGEDWRSKAPLWKYAILAIPSSCASTCQYESLRYVCFVVQMLMKSSKLIPSLLLAAAQGGRFRTAEWTVAILVTAAVLQYLLGGPIATASSIGMPIIGILILIAYQLLDSGTLQWQEHLFRDHRTTKYTQLFFLNFLSCVMCIIVLHFSNTLRPAALFLKMHPEAGIHALILSVAAVGGQWCIFAQVMDFGLAVFTATLNARQIISIGASYWYYQHHITVVQGTALGIFAFGLLYNSIQGLLREASGGVSGALLPRRKPESAPAPTYYTAPQVGP